MPATAQERMERAAERRLRGVQLGHRLASLGLDILDAFVDGLDGEAGEMPDEVLEEVVFDRLDTIVDLPPILEELSDLFLRLVVAKQLVRLYRRAQEDIAEARERNAAMLGHDKPAPLVAHKVASIVPPKYRKPAAPFPPKEPGEP